MISAEDIERGERSLKTAVEVVGNVEDALLARVRIEANAFERFHQDRMGVLRQQMPEIDPRYDAAINTMLRHYFMVGVLTGRDDQ